jgi:hypothetical protein
MLCPFVPVILLGIELSVLGVFLDQTLRRFATLHPFALGVLGTAFWWVDVTLLRLLVSGGVP